MHISLSLSLSLSVSIYVYIYIYIYIYICIDMYICKVLAEEETVAAGAADTAKGAGMLRQMHQRAEV